MQCKQNLQQKFSLYLLPPFMDIHSSKLVNIQELLLVQGATLKNLEFSTRAGTIVDRKKY